MSETRGAELADVARRAMEDFPEYEVIVAFGVLLRATRRGELTPVPVEAKTEEELRAGIERQRSIREFARRDARRQEATP